ncbi:MAG: helix-turn-helix domain-containing protein [Solirubrobacterales bacterium]
MAGQGGEPEGNKPRGDMLLAIAHPLRRQILRKLGEREEPASPIQLADELEGPLGKIAYHVRILCRLGAVSPAGEQQVRGAIEHFYASTVKDDPPIETLLEETKKEDEEEE